MKKSIFRNTSFIFLAVVTIFLQSCKEDQYTKDNDLIEGYLKDHGITDTKTTESGLVYRVEIPSPDEKLIYPEVGQTVRINYEGRLLDKTVFDGGQLEFTAGVGEVVRGFDEGVLLMPENSTYEFFIPSKLGYGSRDYQAIPANSVLIFKVELYNIIHTE